FGKIYDNEDLVRKILLSLPSEWRPKVTAIKESKKFNDIKLSDLYGSLLTHEEILNREHILEVNKSKRSLAFKTVAENTDEDDLEDLNEEELSLLSKQVSRLLRYKKNAKNSKNTVDSSKTNENKNKPFNRIKIGSSSTGCFKCGKTGHKQVECPLWKKEKAFHAGWDASDNESEQSEDERGFMAIADLEENEEKETAKITPSSTATASIEVCLQTLLQDAEWVLDSGCSHHMTGNKNLFYTFQSKERGILMAQMI
ncbi:hypothetical protein LINGRAHAP2_LOCUS31344, partial [Linum grandiflorum]